MIKGESFGVVVSVKIKELTIEQYVVVAQPYRFSKDFTGCLRIVFVCVIPDRDQKRLLLAVS